MDRLIAEDLLLLLLDDQTGRMTHTTYLQTGVGGALLVELALTEAVQVEPKTSWLSRPKVTATSPLSPDDPVLARALATVREKPRAAQDLVTRLGKDQRDVLLGRLADRGVVRRTEERVLGLFPRQAWPAQDSGAEAELRRRLADVLVRGEVPDPRTGALVGLLSAMGIAHRVVDDEGTGKRAVRLRAKQVAEGDWAAKAVRDAIAATEAAVSAAMVASTAAAGGGAT